MITLQSRRNRGSFFYQHSLSIVTLAILALWTVLYLRSDPNTHAGAFFGNAIADWSGSAVIIIGTKYLLERGSEESLPVRGHFKNSIYNFIWCHSLSLFLVITGIGWFVLYAFMDANSRWGQVVGNIASEWVQTLGLVLLTKRLIERGSKESKKK
jgi:hypothetical protein